MSYEAWDRRLGKLRSLAGSGKRIWFNRGPFHQPRFRDTPTMWHVLASREPVGDTPGSYRWSAICGYGKVFDEILLETPRLKLGATQPKRSEQCSRCTNLPNQ